MTNHGQLQRILYKKERKYTAEFKSSIGRYTFSSPSLTEVRKKVKDLGFDFLVSIKNQNGSLLPHCRTIG